VNVCMYMYICIYMYACIHIYIYICIYTYKYKYVYTYICIYTCLHNIYRITMCHRYTILNKTVPFFHTKLCPLLLYYPIVNTYTHINSQNPYQLGEVIHPHLNLTYTILNRPVPFFHAKSWLLITYHQIVNTHVYVSSATVFSGRTLKIT
jgi:hypothetical protein